MTSMWDMPMLPGEDSAGFSALPPRQEPERAPPEDPWRVQPAFGAARNRKLNSDPSFSVLVRCNDALGAPALAGVNDWYLKSSYQSYLEGVRGAHPDDFHGAQMARLAPALAKDDDIDDVIAFITTLPPRRAP